MKLLSTLSSSISWNIPQLVFSCYVYRPLGECIFKKIQGATLKPRNCKPETWNLRPETRNQNLEPETRTGIQNRNPDPESGIWNPESGINKSKKTSSSNSWKLFSIAKNPSILTFFETKILCMLKLVQSYSVLSITFKVDVPTRKVGRSLLFERQRRKLPRGVWGHAPPENFEI